MVDVAGLCCPAAPVLPLPGLVYLQERLSLAVVDDGEQLGPLSPQMREGDRGITAAWGRLHGTKDLEPLSAAAKWKATAVILLMERRIGEEVSALSPRDVCVHHIAVQFMGYGASPLWVMVHHCREQQTLKTVSQTCGIGLSTLFVL